ncbi:MAG: BrxE family protein [Phycisphaerales bacterium JB037]
MPLAMESINLETVFISRVLVALAGDMDGMRWWDSAGTLHDAGRISISRGMPRTHQFARARLAFEVARNRCREVYAPPDAVTLWDLPAEVEAQFDECWPSWLSSGPATFHSAFNADLSDKTDLVAALDSVIGLSDEEHSSVKSMRRAADRNAVPLGDHDRVSNSLILKLAAAFSKGEPGKLAVPFARLGYPA